MADCVSVMVFTFVCDEKRRLGEAAISATGRFLLPSVKAEWSCVGGSGGHPSAIAQGRFFRRAREMAHPQLFRSMSKKQTRYTSPLKWPTGPIPARTDSAVERKNEGNRRQFLSFFLLRFSPGKKTVNEHGEKESSQQVQNIVKKTRLILARRGCTHDLASYESTDKGQQDDTFEREDYLSLRSFF
jgi:hypothetical protein